jgi:ATP-binding cassette subfamily C (CFTR/MRP) protein 4
MCPIPPSASEEKDNEKTLATQLQRENQAKGGPTERPGNLITNASIVSRLFFSWPWPLLSLGLKRPLQELDLPEISPLDTSSINRASLERIWNDEKQKHSDNPTLHRPILKRFLCNVWFVQPMLMAGSIAKVVQAYALGRLVESFTENDSSKSYLWACVMVLCGSIVLFHHHHAFFFTWREGMRLRIACVASIYEKSLRLSSTHQETSASYGKIMNLASNDVERFIQASLFFNHLIWAPLQALAILSVGLVTIGPAFASGFGLLVIVFVPLQFHLSKKFAHYRSKIAAITDKRVTLVSQAVYGVRVMKMSGFEWRFLDRIQKIRQQEIAQIKKADNLKAWNEALFFCTNIVVSLVIFIVHVLIGDQLTPRDVFTVFTLINIMQLELTKHCSMGVMVCSGLSVRVMCISAISYFLLFYQ